MAYYFYLGRDCRLPVAPSKVDIKINSANKTYSLINEGEINVLKKPKLKEIEFDALLPNTKYPFAKYKNNEFHRAEWYLKKLKKLKNNKEKFEFVISRKMPNGKILFDTDIICSLESYTIKEDAKANGTDIIVSIKLKQYRNYGLKTAKVEKDKKVSVTKKRATTKKADKMQTYTVKTGDNPWAIAQMFYGDGQLYYLIYEANKDQVVPGGNIYTGQVLKIPPMPN